MMIVGIDPGAVSTGIVVIKFAGVRTDLVSARTITRAKTDTDILPVPDYYLRDIFAALPDADVYGVETINAPTFHLGRAAYSTGPLLATALVAGACIGHLQGADRTVVQVPPGNNGAAALGQYPDGLVSDAERRRSGWRTRPGSDTAQRRHVRSAHDVAVTARRIHLGSARAAIVPRVATAPRRNTHAPIGHAKALRPRTAEQG